jgi:hypothetical protein
MNKPTPEVELMMIRRQPVKLLTMYCEELNDNGVLENTPTVGELYDRSRNEIQRRIASSRHHSLVYCTCDDNFSGRDMQDHPDVD